LALNENLQQDFLTFTKAAIASRQYEMDLNAFFEECSIKIPEVINEQMHIIDGSDL